MPVHRRTLIVGAITLLAMVALIYAGANLQQWRTDYTQGHAQACGALHYAAGRLMTTTTEAQAAEGCFAHAFSDCHAATLSASVMGVDTGATDTFFVEPPLGPFGSCQIVLTVSHWGLVPIANHTETMTCQTITRTPGQLSVSGCGTLGTVTLPATQGAPSAG
ncbi:MAG TPA: hypothetical protein VE338_12550 [Ktedonobacterales bacterium]|nr:hypothetical protein [Ktedonobacterales bacterium]